MACMPLFKLITQITKFLFVEIAVLQVLQICEARSLHIYFGFQVCQENLTAKVTTLLNAITSLTCKQLPSLTL